MRDSRTLAWDGLGCQIECTDHYVTIAYDRLVRSLSSAVYNGGGSQIRRILNLKVQANPEEIRLTEQTLWAPPEKTLADFIASRGWEGPAAGMMTSALMESYRFSCRQEEWGGVFCALTAGVSNALAAGDEADFHPQLCSEELPTGTINIMLGTNLRLSDAALTEAIMVATEAKAAVLFSHGVRSIRSSAPATGTGTDSIIVSSGSGQRVEFCGKHTRVGQLLAETVIEALGSSLEYLLCRGNPDPQTLSVVNSSKEGTSQIE